MKARKLSSDGWGIGLWFFALSMNFSFALALWGAFDIRTAILDFLITLVITIYISITTQLRISADEEWLYVGKAKIEKKFIKSAEALNKSQMATIRTIEANPDAYLALRFWVPTGVKITIKDERDYTPYWLVSTSKAEEIARELMQ